MTRTGLVRNPTLNSKTRSNRQNNQRRIESTLKYNSMVKQKRCGRCRKPFTIKKVDPDQWLCTKCDNAYKDRIRSYIVKLCVDNIVNSIEQEEWIDTSTKCITPVIAEKIDCLNELV